MIYSDIKYLDEIKNVSDKKDIINLNAFTKLYVYIEDNEIKSFLIYDDIYDRIEIIYIFTVEKYRKKGIARKLFNRLIDDYKNYENITLEVNELNISAINLYRSIGFKKCCKRSNYYNGDDAILMIYNFKGEND